MCFFFLLCNNTVRFERSLAENSTQYRPPSPNCQTRALTPLSQPLVLHQQSLHKYKHVTRLPVLHEGGWASWWMWGLPVSQQRAESGKRSWGDQSAAARPRWSVHGPPLDLHALTRFLWTAEWWLKLQAGAKVKGCGGDFLKLSFHHVCLDMKQFLYE